MTRHALIAVLAGIIVFWLAGCTTLNESVSSLKSGLEGLQDSGTTQIAVIAPERKAIHENDLPSHARFALAALLQKMRHQEDKVREVVFDPAGGHRVRDPRFDFSGFQVYGLDIGEYAFLENTRQLTTVQLGGVLHFADGIGRRCSSVYSLRYDLRPGRPITVRESQVSHLTPPFPDVRAFFVPLKAIKDADPKPQSFVDFYRLAAANAMPMRATAEELAEKKKIDQLSAWQRLTAGSVVSPKTDDYLILVFGMDRMPPQSDLAVKVMSTESTIGESLAQPLYMDDHGFRIAALGGQATLYSDLSRFYVHVLYKPQPDFGNKPILVGRFCSEKDYSPAPVRSVPSATAMVRPVSAPVQPAGVQEGAVSLGKIFLNPAAKNDAALIQGRLADVGYYSGKVDGAFGPGSKAALQAFRKANGLGDSTAWDMNTQRLLFQGSGK
jgi:hypothetical protein